jgi:hypothetical protein
MIERYPAIISDYNKQVEKEAKKTAMDNADGDNEVYMSIYNSEIARYNTNDIDVIFNQSMLIMVYAYYESLLFRIAKENGLGRKKARPSVIACKYNSTLKNEYLKISDYIYYTIRPLRNELCHNNNGTLFSNCEKEEKMRIKELEELKYICITDGDIYIRDKDFVKDVLAKEHKLLLELANICGYKTLKNI